MDIRPVDAEKLSGASDNAQRQQAKQAAQARLSEAVTQAGQSQINVEMAAAQQREQLERAEQTYLNSNLAASERVAAPQDLNPKLAVTSGQDINNEYQLG